MMDKYSKTTQHTGYLYFENGSKVELKCYGEKGVFTGFLNFIEGDFTIEELRYNSNFNQQKQMFFYNNLTTRIGASNPKTKNKIVVLTNFLPLDFDEEKLDNITLATDFEKVDIERLLDCNSYTEKQFIKCCLIFVENDKNIDEEQIQKELKELPNFAFNYNFLQDFKYEKPYQLLKTSLVDDDKIKELPIYQSKKTIGIYDFGISPDLLNILKTYWNVIVLPYDNTAKRTDFLKIDGVIISNSLINTDFISENIKSEISTLINSDIPVLGIDFGAILMCRILNINTIFSPQETMINNYTIRNNNKKNFEVSNSYFYKIDDIIAKNYIEPVFYNYKNDVVGVRYKNNLIYNFTFNQNTLDTAKILNIFELLMQKYPRKYKWN